MALIKSFNKRKKILSRPNWTFFREPFFAAYLIYFHFSVDDWRL